MANFWFFDIIHRQKGTILLAGLFLAAVGFAGLIFSSPKFEVGTDYLVSHTGAGNQDYYTLARSSEYVGKILGQVVYSERFISAVVETGKVDSSFLPVDKKERLKEWKQMVKIEDRLSLGILHVTVLHDNPRIAQQVSEGVGEVLIHKNAQFLGQSGSTTAVSVLSGPIAERNPSVKEIVIVALAGFLLGAFLVILRTFFREEVLRARPTESV